MNCGIFLGLFVTLWALLALTDAQNIQLEPGTVGSGVSGIVRVLHNKQWGTVCHYSFDMKDAKVACRQLGFTKAVGYWRYGRGSGKVWLNYMQCKGTETSLQSCTHNGWGSVASWCNSHIRDVGVVCSGYTGPPQDNIQLEPGTTGLAVAGIVRVYHNNEWGTVCHYYWDMNDAKVACRQLGFTKAVGPMRYGRGSGKVWLDEMKCKGSETSLHSCSHNGWGSVDSGCNSHEYDAGVVCSGYKVRLSGGVNEGRNANPIEGRVEVMYSGLWGTICNDGWGMKESNVLCMMLGHEKAVKTKHFNPAPPSRKMWLRDVSCKGCEASIEECRHPSFGDYKTACKSATGKEVGVICKPKGHSDVKVNLRPTKGNHCARGRVEVEYHGIARSICADNWDLNDAHVICKMNNYSAAASATKVAKGNSDRVWLSDVNCNGTESKIEDCKNVHWNWENKPCQSSNRAGVICIESLPTIFTSPKNLTTTEGQRKNWTLWCGINGPAWNVTWKKDDGPPLGTSSNIIITNSSGTGLANSTLTITSLHRNDDGVYTCTASNVVGTTKPRLSGHLIINYPPKILRSPSPVVKLENETVVISCGFEGKPLPTVQWYVNDTQLNTSGSRLTVSQSGDVRNATSFLTITNVNRTDEGKYKCAASTYSIQRNVASSEALLTIVVFNYSAKIYLRFLGLFRLTERANTLLEKSKAFHEKALAIYHTAETYATVLCHYGETDLALAYCEKVLRVYRSSGHLAWPRVATNLAYIYMKKGRYKDAKDLLQQVIQGQNELGVHMTNARHWLPHSAFAKALVKTGERERGVQMLERCLKEWQEKGLSPDHYWIVGAQKFLENIDK